MYAFFSSYMYRQMVDGKKNMSCVSKSFSLILLKISLYIVKLLSLHDNNIFMIVFVIYNCHITDEIMIFLLMIKIVIRQLVL